MKLPAPYLAVLLSLLLSPLISANLRPRLPRRRTYDSHAYYTLELSSASSPTLASSVAQSLGVELVEPLGELSGHWLVRREGGTPHHDQSKRSSVSDPVLQRWSSLCSTTPRSLDKFHLRSLTPLVLRQRAKRGTSHPFPIRHSSNGLYERDDAELLYAQNDLGLADPMLNQQWHLINTQMRDIELNVTGLWARGITGDGVHVVIVDDGLDLNSDDLSENFVRTFRYPLHCSDDNSSPKDHTISTITPSFPYPVCPMISTVRAVRAR